jgi:hypothetical protein
MSDTTDLGNDLANLARRLTEARIEQSDRELIARVLAVLLASTEERTHLLGQVDQLRAVVAEQQTLIDHLREENTLLTAERDQYLRSLYSYVRKEMMPSEEELAFLKQLDPTKKNGVSFEEILKMIEELPGA